MPAASADSLRFLPGVGPARAAKLAAAGITSVAHILTQSTRCLEPAPDEHTFGDLPRGTAVVVRARIERVSLQAFGRRRTLSVRAIRCDDSPLTVRFFNAGYLRDKLPPGEWFLFEGKSDAKQRNTLNQPRFTHLSADAPLTSATSSADGCEVAYQTPRGISDRAWQQLINHCLDHHLQELHDPLAQLSDSDYQLAIRNLHRPATPEDHQAALRIGAEREAFALAALLHKRRQAATAQAGTAWPWNKNLEQRALARLPFALTPSQRQAVDDIMTDLTAPHPMYRLLHGDVGSGKTAVAFIAALSVISGGGQVLWLAPTAILANQHAAFCQQCLTDSKVHIATLTGKAPAAERKNILDQLGTGALHILIGTHALLEDQVQCKNLGLAIIDEQHKFGVEQRARLLSGSQNGGQCDSQSDSQSGRAPDLLALSATPIPRTVTLTIFGDLAVSRITDKPPGRAPVTTSLTKWEFSSLVEELRQTLVNGGSAFVVTPLREDSQTIRAPNAINLSTRLQAALPDYNIALIHGALSEAEKQRAINSFSSKQSQVLVGTTVIEVGIDMPDATLMAIIAAERFGLAQLHQLRGRIGRGQRPGNCILYLSDPAAFQRVKILEQSNDGFRIAESDLADRGPGDLFGTRQHGLPNLKFLDLGTDIDLIQNAHAQVERVIKTDPKKLLQTQTIFLSMESATTLSGG